MNKVAAAGLLCAVLFLQASAALPQTRVTEAPASLQGVITQLGTTRTLSKVSVELRGASQTFTTTTEDDGRFYFTNVKPGSYRLSAKRGGFIEAEYAQQWVKGPGQPVVVAAGDNLKNLNMFLVGAGTISGRITDGVGRPVANAQVSALRVTFQGLKRVLESVQEARTNDLGEYRLFWLLPGRYYLAAVALSGNSDPFIRGGQIQGTRSVLGASAYNSTASGNPPQPTFYPSVASADAAMPVEVVSGGEARDVEIRLIPISSYHVCGVVNVNGELPPPREESQPKPTVPVPTPAPPAQQRPPDICADVVGRPLSLTNVGPIWLAPPGTAADVANVASDIQQTTLDMATGRFIFRNVRPGSYELSTIMNGMYARANVEVRESHIENLSLDLTRGVDLTVRFLAEEGASGIAPLALLLPYLGDDPPSPREAMRGEAPKDGRATIRNVPPDDYRVYLEPLLTSAVAPTSSIPPALQQVYIKSIMLGTDDALNAPLHFKGDPDVTLDIIIGANPAVLEGVVLDASGAPVRGAIVSLLPNANSTSRNRVFRRDMYRMVISDLEGRFKATGIPPGDYKVFAWAGIERNGWLDPDLQHAYEDRGVSVKVEERSAVTLELHLIVPGL